MMKVYSAGLSLILITLSCAKDQQILKDDNSVVHENSFTLGYELKENKNFESFPNIPTRSFPIVDSTNFDNYKDQDGLENNLFVNETGFQKKNPDAENIRLRYLLRFSDQYYSTVISYRNGEHEMFTTLINTTKDKKIIDQLPIAYDEIAESAFRKTSTMDQNKIVVEDWNYMNEEPTKETSTYQISKEGNFIIIPKVKNP